MYRAAAWHSESKERLGNFCVLLFILWQRKFMFPFYKCHSHLVCNTTRSSLFCQPSLKKTPGVVFTHTVQTTIFAVLPFFYTLESDITQHRHAKERHSYLNRIHRSNEIHGVTSQKSRHRENLIHCWKHLVQSFSTCLLPHLLWSLAKSVWIPSCETRHCTSLD